MATARRLLTLAVCTALTTPAVQAADQAPLVDELRQIVERSRQERAADRWLQGALEDLLARYDRPAQREILYEDFRDGDYSQNPSWQVLRGAFEVRRGQGLYSSAQHDAAPATGNGQPASPGEALSGLIVGALLDRALGPSATPQDNAVGAAAGPSEIRLKGDVSNAFAIELGFRQGRGEGAFEIALLQDETGSYGYRLRLQSGPRGFVELQRIRRGQGAIVESRPLTRDIADGALHALGWEQDPDGTVTVRLDDSAVFSVRDRAFRDPYPWFHLINDQGELTIRSLRISGV
jgi:hypothetical protein